MYLIRELPTFTGWQSDFPCWLSREHLPIMTPKPVAWVPRFVKLKLDVFIMGGILWSAPYTYVTENSHGGCSWTAGHIIIINFIILRVFHTDVCRLFLTGVWITASPSYFQDSSKYIRWSKKCCSLDRLHSSCYFSALQSLHPDCTKSTNFNIYHWYFHVPQSSLFPCKVQVLIIFFALLQFYSVDSPKIKVHIWIRFLCFLLLWGPVV